MLQARSPELVACRASCDLEPNLFPLETPFPTIRYHIENCRITGSCGAESIRHVFRWKFCGQSVVDTDRLPDRVRVLPLRVPASECSVCRSGIAARCCRRCGFGLAAALAGAVFVFASGGAAGSRRNGVSLPRRNSRAGADLHGSLARGLADRLHPPRTKLSRRRPDRRGPFGQSTMGLAPCCSSRCRSNRCAGGAGSRGSLSSRDSLDPAWTH